ncbi:restriction endonuclease subunit S [Pseudomonas sp.]|jgi:type I restriction enzyme S subunit|uniref:restriction endonuclease subunit S n=1 Tax=Pseudomonas sp. TaxID=306 RepID=UPI0037C7EFDE
MKAGWQTLKLGELVDVQNGYAFSSKDYSNAGHFVMRIGNVQNGFISIADPKFIKLPVDGSLQRFALSEGDILVSLTGNVGRVGVIQEEHLPAALNQRVARVTVREDSAVTRDLLLLFLTSEWFRQELTGAGHGAAQQNVSTKDITGIQIPVPPLPEQRRIVAILDEAFDGIATAKANTEKNLQYARALLESHLQSVFTERGEGWSEKTLAVLCELISGQHIDAKDYNTNGRGVGYLTGPSDFGALNPVITKWSEHPKRMARAGDILVTVKGSGVGKINLLDTNEVAISRQLMAIRAITADVSYLYAFLSTKFEYFQSLSTGAAIPGISREDVLNLMCPMPPPEEQPAIVELIHVMQKETQRLESIYQQKLTALDDLKKSLLHQAFSGNL